MSTSRTRRHEYTRGNQAAHVTRRESGSHVNVVMERSFATMFLLLSLKRIEIIVQTVELSSPKKTRVLHPVGDVLERSGLQPASVAKKALRHPYCTNRLIIRQVKYLLDRGLSRAVTLCERLAT